MKVHNHHNLGLYCGCFLKEENTGKLIRERNEIFWFRCNSISIPSPSHIQKGSKTEDFSTKPHRKYETLWGNIINKFLKTFNLCTSSFFPPSANIHSMLVLVFSQSRWYFMHTFPLALSCTCWNSCWNLFYHCAPSVLHNPSNIHVQGRKAHGDLIWGTCGDCKNDLDPQYFIFFFMYGGVVVCKAPVPSKERKDIA